MTQPTSQRFDRQTLEAWRHSPLNQIFLQFLRDQQEELGHRWMRGSAFPAPSRSEEQVKALLMGELATLDWDSYSAFYGIDGDGPVE